MLLITMGSPAKPAQHPQSFTTTPFHKPGEMAAGQAYLTHCTRSMCIPAPCDLELITEDARDELEEVQLGQK